jgi:hypothetical protein
MEYIDKPAEETDATLEDKVKTEETPERPDYWVGDDDDGYTD